MVLCTPTACAFRRMKICKFRLSIIWSTGMGVSDGKFRTACVCQWLMASSGYAICMLSPGGNATAPEPLVQWRCWRFDFKIIRQTCRRCSACAAAKTTNGAEAEPWFDRREISQNQPFLFNVSPMYEQCPHYVHKTITFAVHIYVCIYIHIYK